MQKRETYEAVKFLGPDPARSKFVRLNTNNLNEAKNFAKDTKFFGFVAKNGVTVMKFPEDN